ASQVVQGLPRELDRIIGRCLRKSPERRFQTMADLKVALEELKEESNSGALSAMPVPVRRRRRGLTWAAALLAIIAWAAGRCGFFGRPPRLQKRCSVLFPSLLTRVFKVSRAFLLTPTRWPSSGMKKSGTTPTYTSN